MGDTSGAATEVTLWNVKAIQWDSPVGTVVALKGARVYDYNGTSFPFF